LLLFVISFPGLPAKDRPPVTFESATKCIGDHGEWRWTFKTDAEKPTADIPMSHQVTPADVADWAVPNEKIGSDTPVAA
jgi:hypothetical protein